MAKQVNTQPFYPDQFANTAWHSAAGKAELANLILRFILNGFTRADFTEALYQELCQLFGSTALYSRIPYYEHWFAEIKSCEKFLDILISWSPAGDPHCSMSDVEKALQIWLLAEKETVDEAMVRAYRLRREMTREEKARMSQVRNQPYQTFIVAAMSKNVGSFGHRQCVMIAEDGASYTVLRSISGGFRQWKENERISVPLVEGEPNWGRLSVECPTRLENAPKDVVDALFQTKTGVAS